MKKQWTKIWSLAFKKAGERGVNGDQRQYVRAWSIYKHMFLKHHQNADEIFFSNDGTPLEARYKCGDMRDKVPSAFQIEFKDAQESEG